MNIPFFSRTTDTFVNLIWFEGWLMPTGMVANKSCMYEKEAVDGVK
jgi:hypothetical protein